MTLVKDGNKFSSESETVIKAYKQNGWTEEVKEVKAAPKKNIKE